MKTISIGGVELSVNEKVSAFEVLQKPSSNVEFFGINLQEDKLFMQFKNGTSYIYTGVPLDTLKNARTAESIGKYFGSHISGKFASEKIAERLVQPVEPQENFEPGFI